MCLFVLVVSDLHMCVVCTYTRFHIPTVCGLNCINKGWFTQRPVWLPPSVCLCVCVCVRTSSWLVSDRRKWHVDMCVCMYTHEWHACTFVHVRP